MPEGPEVWILSKAINAYFANKKTSSRGKHLFVLDANENWSFGLNGKVQLTNNDLSKLNAGWINGEQVRYENYEAEVGNLGIDFMTSEESKIRVEVDKWIKSKKKLAALILDQSKIAGIGVAWGSEILFRADLRPDMRACEQNLSKLVNSIIYIREKIKNIYEKELKEMEESLEEFINNWFENLYDVREMHIYKLGSKLEVLGRNWWV